MAAIAPAKGQIWREIDPRKIRYVKIIGVDRDSVAIETVERSSVGWRRKRGTGRTVATLARFNGSRGGYDFEAQPREKTT